ncbi:hypothetical protein VM1G_11641 [Cytospora mali]|uniref:Uncharacterized protein n=1 Tax=Cytospora mali TaxID=578113 RepID=A0A194VYP2_CYTMA|nr:hypothetical protein VM1G_11641 [Valsa mali]
MAVQTEEAKDNSDDVEMKDSATSTLATHIDAAVETSQCNDVWLPCSKSLDLVSWAKDQYDKQLEEAADVLRTTDSSRKDYRDKVYLAAQCGLEFELELRERCEKALENSS